MKKWLLTIFIFYAIDACSQDSLFTNAAVQSSTDSISKYKKRQWLVGGLTAAGYGGSFLFLSQAWYKDFPRTGFHTFNDGGEWLQIDKVGHAWTTYHTSRLTSSWWQWAGLDQHKAVLYGTTTSVAYMLAIEYLDGRSSEWGWSWADVGANLTGAALFAGQAIAWNDQKLGIKFSSQYKNYNDPVLKQRADDLYGKSFQGRILKDYNAQTYWVTANIKSFIPTTTLPAWLNVAVGYGAEGMFGGYENIAINKNNGAVIFDRRDVKRYRQFFLSPDIDLTRIRTKHKWLKSVFSAFNVLKFPAPALELSNGKLRLKALAY